MDPLCLLVQRFFDEVHFSRAFRRRENLAPNRVVDAAFCLPIGVKRFVHPAEFVLDLSQDSLCLFRKLVDVERRL